MLEKLGRNGLFIDEIDQNIFASQRTIIVLSSCPIIQTLNFVQCAIEEFLNRAYNNTMYSVYSLSQLSHSSSTGSHCGSSVQRRVFTVSLSENLKPISHAYSAIVS